MVLAAWMLIPALLGQPADDDCRLPHVDSYAFFESTAPERRAGLEEARARLCTSIANAPDSRRSQVTRRAVRTLDALVFRRAYCRGGVPNPVPWAGLAAFRGLHEALLNVFGTYCRDTAAQVTSAHIVQRTLWARREFFCQGTRWLSNQGAVVTAEVAELPCMRRSKALADTLCQRLRNGTIALEEARYRWSQEQLWVREHVFAELEHVRGERAAREAREQIDLALRLAGLFL